MKFREYDLDDIIVVGPTNKNKFLLELKKLHEEYDVIDLQYSTLRSAASDLIQREEGFSLHSALALVRKK